MHDALTDVISMNKRIKTVIGFYCSRGIVLGAALLLLDILGVADDNIAFCGEMKRAGCGIVLTF
jgi:hypothetical protein